MRRSRWGYLITRTPAGTTAMLGYGLGALVPPEPSSPSGKFLDSTGTFSVPAGGGVTYGSIVAETSYGQASTAGTSTYVSRADHTHGSPSLSTATPSALGVAAAGTALYPSKSDHVHAMPSAADVGAISLVLTTTKGDIIVDDGTSPQRRGVGANGTMLTADSTESLGVRWATPPVTSVFTRTGAVVATTGDYTAAQVGALSATESGGQSLTTAAIPDLSVLARSGTTVAGVAPPTSGQRVGKALGWTSDGTIGWVPIAVVVGVLGRGDIVIEGRTVLDHAATSVTVGIL